MALGLAEAFRLPQETVRNGSEAIRTDQAVFISCGRQTERQQIPVLPLFSQISLFQMRFPPFCQTRRMFCRRARAGRFISVRKEHGHTQTSPEARRRALALTLGETS